MKRSYFTYIALAAFTLSACTTDEVTEPTSGTPIRLSAGIGNASDMQTRADIYNAFATGSQIALRADGDWTHGGTTTHVSKTSTGIAQAASGTSNAATTNPVLYWDDYGTADPDNGAGRTNGLTIYGAAVDDGGTTKLVASSWNWTAQTWTLPTTQTTAGWSANDLLLSNNIKGDNTYKFAGRGTAAGLEFHHAMSKVTVNLYEGNGFTDTEVTTGLTASVTLLGAYYTGSVNTEERTVTVTAGSKSDIGMKKGTGNSTDIANGTANQKPYVSFTALAFPGTSQFAASANILKVVVNNNTYYVTADNMIAANANSTTTESGKDYIFNVKVSKTAISVSATVVDWNDVNATQDAPEILTLDARQNGVTGTGTVPSTFYLWYTKTANNPTGYNTCQDMVGTATGTTAPATVNVSSGTYTLNPILYWHDHVTKYNLRAAVLNDASLTQPTVTTDATGGDYIALSYGSNASNDLMWGTHEANNATNMSGVTATKGNVVFTFYHKMSEVTVQLTTPTTADAVTLTNATVELLQSNTTGKMLMGSGIISSTTLADKTIDVLSADNHTYQTFAIPQTLTNDMKFKVTITNTDGTTDTYYAQVNQIEVGGSTIEGWAEGTHYTYTLNIKKTGLSVSAKVVNWASATGSTDVIL
jgi:hypothetical protein